MPRSNAIFSSENLAPDARRVSRPNHSHLIFCEPAIISPWESPFLSRVALVVGIRPKKQMARVYAGRVVALVKNEQALRYRADVKHPRKAMRQPNVNARNPETPVPIGIGGSRPQPASVGFVNVFPETNGEWYFASTHDLNLHDRLGLWSGSFVATNNVRAASILA